MSESSLPNYNSLLQGGPRSRPLAKKILGLLLKSGKELHPTSKETLKKLFPNSPEDKLEDQKSKVNSSVSHLKYYNFVEGERYGPIRLKYRTPLCWLANTPNVPFAYIGLLGERRYPVSITDTAIELLKTDPNVGVEPERVVIVTSPKIVAEWDGAINVRVDEWKTMSEDELNDIDEVERRITWKIIELMRDYILIMDLTSGPRTAGIAFYELAIQFKIPLIYVYYPKKRLRWLNSRERLMREVGDVFYIEPEEKGERGPPTAKIRKKGEIY